MSDLNTLPGLEQRHRELLFALRLPDAVLAPDAPPFLRALDLNFARQLFSADQPWGHEDAFDERLRFLNEVLSASPEGRKLYLASEVDLLSRVKETGKEVIHSGPFGIREAIFPIQLRGHVVHILRSGKFRDAALPHDDIKELSFLTGVPVSRLEEAAKAIPVLDDARRDQMITLLRRLRDASARALSEHERVVDLTDLQVRTERVQALGAMAEGMAHHVNDLLSTIVAYSAALQDRTNLPEEISVLLRRIGEEAQRGRRFTDEVVAMAASDAERETACPLHERIRGALMLLQPQMGTKIKLETRLDAENDHVAAQPRVLQQIIYNLITNALDNMPTGGLLTIASRNLKDERDPDAPQYLRLEITDSSGAMPRRHLRKSDGSRTTSSGLAGENLGPKLTSVFSMAGRMGGTVTVSSDPGMMTRVELTLPSSTAEFVDAPAVEPRKQRRLAPSNIWVVDDDRVVREMCRRVLAEEGHTVTEVESGEDLRDRCIEKKEKPDLIIYDFSMPDYDGLEMTSYLRQEQVRIPMLLISGLRPDQPELSKTLKLRKTFYLQKPFSFRDMTDMVTVALGETLIEE